MNMVPNNMVPTIYHSREGKTIETVQRAMVTRGQRKEKDEYGTQWIFRHWNYSVWYLNDGYVKLQAFVNTHRITQHIMLEVWFIHSKTKVIINTEEEKSTWLSQ